MLETAARLLLTHNTLDRWLTFADLDAQSDMLRNV